MGMTRPQGWKTRLYQRGRILFCAGDVGGGEDRYLYSGLTMHFRLCPSMGVAL